MRKGNTVPTVTGTGWGSVTMGPPEGFDFFHEVQVGNGDGEGRPDEREKGFCKTLFHKYSLR